MELYQSTFSPNAKRVRVLAAELGIALDIKNLDFAKRENRGEAYLAKNPMGKVPTLVDGDVTLWESPAILVYLAQKHGKLVGNEPRAFADQLRWITWNASHFEVPLYHVVVERVLKTMRGGGPPDQARIDAAMKDVERYAPIADKHLAGRTWFTDEFSIVDIALGTSMDIAGAASVDLSKYEHLVRWYGRVRERPSWRA